MNIFHVPIWNRISQLSMIKFWILGPSKMCFVNISVAVPDGWNQDLIVDTVTLDERDGVRSNIDEKLFDSLVDEGGERLSSEIAGFVTGASVFFEMYKTVKKTELSNVTFKFFALDGAVGHFFSEEPERSVSHLLLTDLNNICSEQNVVEVFLSGLVFSNILLNTYHFKN